jgi:hypothetical protein
MARRRWELWRSKGGVKDACELARALLVFPVSQISFSQLSTLNHSGR